MNQPVLRRSLALSDQLELLEMAGKMSGVGYWRIDASGPSVNWSDQVYVIHGVDPLSFDPNYDNAVGFYHPDDRPRVDKYLQSALTTGAGFEFQFRLVRADGELRHVTCKAECEKDPDGSVKAIFGVFQDVTDHVVALKAAELAKEEAEETARRAAVAERIAGLGHWRVDLPSRRLTWSEQMYVIHGVDVADPLNVDGYAQMIHPDDRQRALDRVEQDVQGRPCSERLGVRIVRPDGAIRWVVGEATVERDVSGRVSAIVGTVIDITQKQLAELEVVESESRYRLITENSHDIVVKYSTCGVVRYASPAVESLLGYTPGEMVGQATSHHVHVDDRDACREAFLAAASGVDVDRRDYRLLHKDGSILWVDARPRALLDQRTGEIIGVTDVIRDATERKRAEAALAASEERYRFLADNATDMLAQCEYDGAVTFVSPGCLHTLGYDSQEMLGRRIIDFAHPDDVSSVAGYFADLVRQGPGATGASFQFRARRKDGVWIWLEGQPKVFFDETGDPVMVQDVLRDITTRKTLEIELDQARQVAQAASQVKSEFLSNMSHELRTPLTSILGFSSMLKEEGGLTDLGARAASRVCDSAGALLGIVNDILDFSKLEAGQMLIDPHPVDVEGLLKTAVELLEPQAREKGLTLNFFTSGVLPRHGWLDDARVRQILLNLLSNGVKFTQRGGVSLKASYLEGSQRLRCEIEDTGDGVPANRLDRLFKRFSQVDGSSTRSHGGTGLGLSICKGLIDAMGGAIGVRSVPEEGSVFWFEIPCAPLIPDEGADGLACVASGLTGVRVLVAGDDVGAMSLVRQTLAPLGVLLTQTSAEDLQSMAEGASYDLILLASKGLGSDDMSAVHSVRSGDGPNDLTPILAFAEACDGSEAWDADLDGYIPMPVKAEALVSIITRWTTSQNRAEPQSMIAPR